MEGSENPMTGRFDKDFWDERWRASLGEVVDSGAGSWPNPYLSRELSGLEPGSALDAGCGAGAEAIWLASHGWQVVAVDIARQALERARERSRVMEVSDRITWVEADLCTWDPEDRFDLVTSHYAHPAMPQLDFYERIATWVNPGGTLLLVGHLHAPGAAGHGHHPPADASVTVSAVTARFSAPEWRIETAADHVRTVTRPDGGDVSLRDVVVRVVRRM
jgi:SAM-dependent methyltransferase